MHNVISPYQTTYSALIQSHKDNQANSFIAEVTSNMLLKNLLTSSIGA